MNRIHFSVIDSTNNWAKGHADELDPSVVTVVTAEEQTAGRGRFKRPWLSPPGQNVYATFCFFLPHLTPALANIAQILALSVCELLQNHGISSQFKWPNDLLVNGKKIGGVLCETLASQRLCCVLLGLGLNVNMSSVWLEKIGRPATSLAALGVASDVETLLQELQHLFDRDLHLFLKEGFRPFFNDFVSRLSLKPGDRLTLSDVQGRWEGTFESIGPDGSLSLRLLGGGVKVFRTGEVSKKNSAGTTGKITNHGSCR